MSSIYFAHSMVIYNTEEETRIREGIGSPSLGGMKLICPNRDLQDKFGKDMDSYLNFVKTCSLVMVLEYKGYVGVV